VHFTFFIKLKTRNQLNIHLVHLLAVENKYIDDSFVVVTQKRFLILLKKLFTDIIC